MAQPTEELSDFLVRLRIALGDGEADSDADECIAWVKRLQSFREDVDEHIGAWQLLAPEHRALVRFELNKHAEGLAMVARKSDDAYSMDDADGLAFHTRMMAGSLAYNIASNLLLLVSKPVSK